MSHHSGDENMLIATSDSFWEPGNYRRTTKRVDDSFKLCSDLVNLIGERAEIEKNYAKNLKNWSKKWNDIIEKGPEYGTTEAAWKGVLVEADRLNDIHLKIKDKLCSEIIEQVKTWQKDTYHKNSYLLQGVIQCKIRKEMEDSFKKAQKPWAKLLTKVNKTKTSYHVACKAEKSALNQERNAINDSSLSQDHLKKLQDRVTKSKEEVQKTREKYETALQDINNYNAKYMDDMTVVFDKCQELEALRLQFFKEILFSIHKVLNISQYPELPQIYEEFYHTINNADYEKDLKWWSNNHGVNMAMNWPQFEDYVEEFREITKGKSKESLPVPNIMLINQRPVGEDFRDLPLTTNSSSYTNSNSSKSVVTGGGNGSGSINMSKLLKNSNEVATHSTKSATTAITSSTNNSNTNSSDSNSMNKKSVQENNKNAISTLNKSLSNGTSGDSRNDTNPFEEDEWDENDALVDNGEPGIPVRALYDYERAESDELSFKQGDVFEKLEDEDEQGWCKGRKDGRVGLYPANYVKEISQ